MGKKKKSKHGKHVHTEMRFAVSPQVAGVAAAALKQVGTPAFQQLIAGALGAAGQAMEQMARRSAGGHAAAAPTPPPPPPSPIVPEPPVPPEPRGAYRPAFETPPIGLPPEAVQAIEQVTHKAAQAIEGAAAHASQAIEAAAAAFERWAEDQARSKPKE